MDERLEHLLGIMERCVLNAEFCDGCPCLSESYDTCRQTQDEFFSRIHGLIHEHHALKADMQAACEGNNPCMVCGHFKPERYGHEKCELNGWHCSWEWKGVQNP